MIKLKRESSDNMRDTYALINLTYLKENIKEIKSKYNNYKYYIGGVKANAYGHGDYIVNALEEAGINYLAVSSLEEALSIRKHNTNLPILCFGYVDIKEIDKVVENNITLSIISKEYFNELKKVNKNIKIHIKLNTGMNRFGIKDKDEVKKIIDDVKNTNMTLEGIYTHLATSGVNDSYYNYQINKFEELTSLIDLNEIPLVHVFNSLGLARHKKLEYTNAVRLGLMMYGFTYNVEDSFINKFRRRLKNKNDVMLNNNLKLKKVLSLHSEIVNINKVENKEFVGYNAKYISDKDNYIGIVSIGHADGVTNSYKEVIINNKKYPIVSYSMDYIMVLIDETVKLHDKVTLIGESITAGTIAGNTDTPHHILVSISNRVDRKYEE